MMKHYLPIAEVVVFFFLQLSLVFIAGFQVDVVKPSSSSSSHWRSARASTSLSAKCREGSLQVTRTLQQPDNVTKAFNLSYTIHRPMTLSSQKACPILVLHGGPSVPSSYLLPLVNVVPYRSIVLYDQLGCGKSDEPDDIDAYSIEKGVDDLEALIKSLGLRKFHLFGHSFGGILGYEFLKRIAERRNEDVDAGDHVLSFIIASTTTSVPLVEAEAQSLIATLLEQDDVEESTVGGRFEKEHICRMLERPQPLKDAYSHAGTVWRGTGAIADYVAMPPQSDSAAPLPPAMVLRGEHDFVTKACIQDWKESIWKHKRIRERELPGCSHHGLLENAFLFGDFVDSFCTEYDP